MAGTVTTDLAWFVGVTSPYYNSNCDQVTDWVAAPTLDTENFVQGTGALAAKVSKTVFTSVFTVQDPAVNLTGKQIFIWAMCSGRLDTKAGGGLRIRVENAAGQFGEWTVAGRDTWGGGWMPWTVHTSTAFDAGATIPDVTAVKKVGIVFDVVGSAVALNCWWDAMRYGTGLSVKGGTDVSPATLQDFLDAEDVVLTGKYGVVFLYEGLLIVQGKLNFGSTTVDEVTYFKDTTERVLIFADKSVPTDYYEIKLQGNANTAITKIYFGEKIGGSGVSGITVRASSFSKPFKVTASDTNITEYGFYGCTFYQAANIVLQPYSSVKEFLGCSVSKSGQILPSTGIVKYCNIMTAVNKAILISSASHNITNCNFINNPRATEISVAATISFSYLSFSGNTYVALNSSGSPITVQHSNSEADVWNYDPAGSTVTFQASVTLTIRRVKTGNEPAEYVRCSIHRKSDMGEILNMDAMVGDDLNPGYYKASDTYTQTGISVLVRAREKGWLPFETELTITSSGLDVSAVWLPDPNYQA